MESPLEVYETLPIVPLRDVVVFPHMMMPFVIGRPSSTRALEHALAEYNIPVETSVVDDIMETYIHRLGA